MASTQTKAAKAEALAKIPAISLMLTFIFGLKDEFKPTKESPITEVGGTTIADLPLTVQESFQLNGRLKGFQYSPEFVAFMQSVEKKENAGFYEIKEVYITSAKSEAPVKTTLRTLTDSVSLISFMLNNGPKLYLSAVEQKLGSRIQDRNFAEVVGEFINADVAKVHLSKSTVKYVKEDIRDISAANSVLSEEEYADSPVRGMRNAIYALPEIARKVEAKKAAAKLLAEQKKAVKFIGSSK